MVQPFWKLVVMFPLIYFKRKEQKLSERAQSELLSRLVGQGASGQKATGVEQLHLLLWL